MVSVWPVAVPPVPTATVIVSAAPLRLFLFLNGNLLSAGTAYDLAGSTITMIPPFIPLSTDILRAEVW